MYMLDWTEMHILGLFHLKLLQARSFGPGYILMIYDDRLVMIKSSPDILEALEQYGVNSILTDKLNVDRISNFHLEERHSERRVTSEKTYQCILTDKMLIMASALLQMCISV